MLDFVTLPFDFSFVDLKVGFQLTVMTGHVHLYLSFSLESTLTNIQNCILTFPPHALGSPAPFLGTLLVPTGCDSED